MSFDPNQERDAQGRWAAGGGDSLGKDRLNMADLHARGITTTRWNLRDPAKMTNGEINKELDRIAKVSSQINSDLIQQGRSHEKPSETVTKSDALSQRYIAVSNRHDELRYEVGKRYPGGISRLPPNNRSFTIGRRVKKL